MSLKTKTRIVVTVLLVLAVWPLNHRVIVHMTDMSPWKGFGWAMYCVPKRMIAIQVDPTKLLAEQPAKVPNEVQRVIDRATRQYIERRLSLGWRAAPNKLARVLFDAHPHVQSMVITVKQRGVDRQTARLVSQRTDRFDYDRTVLNNKTR